MTRHRDPLIEPINDWLNRQTGGKSTPAVLVPANTEFEQIVRSARRFHGLAQAETQMLAGEIGLQEWEHIMADTMTANQAGARAMPRTVEQWLRPVRDQAQISRLGAFANGAMAAVLVLAIVAGLWRINGGFGPGGSNEPDTITVGNQFVHESTPEPQGHVDPATLPKAEDCTIEPLTIDQVIDYARYPDAYMDPYSLFGPPWATPVPGSEVALELEQPSPEVLASASETFHMFESCIQAENYFAMWATMTPAGVHSHILNFVPFLTSEEDLRAALEDLKANGPKPYTAGDRSKPVFTWLRNADGTGQPTDMVSVIDTRAGQTLLVGDNQLVATRMSYEPDGSLFTTTQPLFDASISLPMGVDNKVGSDLMDDVMTRCSPMRFMFNSETGVWAIAYIPGCG